MILGVIVSLIGICLLVALIFQMAAFALPLFAGVTAGRQARVGLAASSSGSWPRS